MGHGDGRNITEITPRGSGQNEENTIASYEQKGKASRKKAKRSKQRASGILQLSAKAGTGMIEQLLMMVGMSALLPLMISIDW